MYCDVRVGSVHETDAQHLMRHAVPDKNCFRCMVINNRAEIAKVAPWASERPSELGGAWRMGCRICFAGRKSPAVIARKAVHVDINKGKEMCKQAIARCSVLNLGGFQYIPQGVLRLNRIKETLRVHAASDFHRLSAMVNGCPGPKEITTVNKHDRTSLNIMAKPFSRKQELLARLAAVAAPVQPAVQGGQPERPGQPAAPSNIGSPDFHVGQCVDHFRQFGSRTATDRAVPQRQDWIDMWAECSSFVSIRKSEVIREKRRANGKLMTNYQGPRARKRKMIRVAAEVARESCRKRIREATSITLAVDECDTRKVIRLRCDTPQPPYQWDGVIGICKKEYGMTGDISSELKDDHAVHN